jgi:hypothetical protein
VAQFTSFAALGTLSTAQRLIQAVTDDIGDMDGFDRELVAEETLCLAATATARAAAVGLQDASDQADVIHRTLLRLPFAYRDYLLGSAMVAGGDRSLAERGPEIRERLARKQEFYTTHLPDGQFPGPRALGEKMALWMGRISPPKLPETPQERLDKLGLVGPLVTHCKLILAYGRQGEPPGAGDAPASGTGEDAA